MNHIMIDMETVGTKPDCSILTIAAVKFNPFGDDSKTHAFDMEHLYARVDIESNKEQGRVAYKDTMEWWMNQSPEARAEAFAKDDRHPLGEVLEALRDFCREEKNALYWSNGSTFDFPILENAYDGFDEEYPWKFWEIRDQRTFVKSTPIKPIRGGYHHAVYDCYNQIIALQKAIRYLEIDRLY